MPKYVEFYGTQTLGTFCTNDDLDVTLHGEEEKAKGFLSKRTWLLHVDFWKSLFMDMFMPRGYPESVSIDYLDYQSWDTLQAFASSMNSALATEAVLRGVGVGNEDASAMAATVAWLLKDGTGMITGILFAWRNSPYFDGYCKQWRLVADFFNDLAFLLDLIAPLFAHRFTLIVCISSMLRAVVGVAGGATRNTVTNHQAISDNVGDVAAKDGSQETLVNVSALICSLLLLPVISGKTVIVWLLFLVFTFTHLYGNYRAVKSLQFRTLNRSVLRIIARNYTKTGKTGSICEVNDEEPLVLPLRQWSSKRFYGCRLSEAVDSSKGFSFHSSKFIVTCDLRSECGYIAMASQFNTPEQQLRAALCLELMLMKRTLPSSDELDEFMKQMKKAGWLTNKHRLVFDHWTYSEK